MDLKPTEQMAKNAERGLKLRKEFNRGGTEVGVARATQLKNRENLSPETIKRMTSYFARHAGDNLSETDPPSAGYIAWLLWGGDAGRDWAERKAKQIDEQKENEMKTIEQKKLAVIKSNAAPEVKLRALEKLNASDATVEKAKQELSKLLQLVGLRASIALLKEEKDLRSLEQYANLIVSMLEKMKSPKIEKIKGELRQLGVYRNSLKDNDNNVKNNWVKQDASDYDLRRLKELNDAIINLCKGGASLESKVTGLSNLKSMIGTLEYVNKEIARALGGKK